MPNKRKTYITVISVIVFIILGVACGIFLSSIEIKDMDLSETEDNYSSGDITIEYSNGDTVYRPDESDLSYDEDSYAIYYDNLLIVYTLTDMSKADAESLAALVGGIIVGDISGAVNALQIKVASTDLESLNAYADILMESDQVLYASYEMPMAASASTTVDQNPWSDGAVIADKNEDTPSGNDWWAEAIDSYSAWEYVDNNTDTLSSVIVGILDSGFDIDHEDLGNISVINENSAEDHGTHVAGIIAAQNNTIGIRGIADGATLLCADWSVETSTENDAIETENLLSTGEWIELTKQLLESGAKVINNSWGLNQDLFDKILSDFYDALSLENKSRYDSMFGSKTEIWEQYAFNTGNQCLWMMACLINSVNNGEISDFLIVQSAGNGYGNAGPGYDASMNGYYCSIIEDNYPEYSLYLENAGITYNVIKKHIMIVGAVMNERNNDGYYLLSSYSNYGDAVDICAPGGEYSASADGGTEIFSLYADDSYGCFYGTSMAAPMVSGTAALIWSINPSLTAAEVNNIMLENCSVAMGVTGEDAGVTYPMLNVGLVVRAASNLTQTETNTETKEILVESETDNTKEQSFVDGTYVIGICQLVEHDSLDAAVLGFKNALLNYSDTAFTFDERNAAGDYANCETIVNGFVGSNDDLILAVSSYSIRAAVGATGEIPILGTCVTDYPGILNISDWTGVVGGNVSGTTDLPPVYEIANMIQELFPEAQTIGLLYCDQYDFCVLQCELMEEYLNARGYTVDWYPFTGDIDLESATRQACNNCDVIYSPLNNMGTSEQYAEMIANVVNNFSVPVVTGDSEICIACGVATLSIDYYNLGYVTGEMAFDVLVNNSDIGSVPVKYATETIKQYNPDVCTKLGITVPEDYVKIQSE